MAAQSKNYPATFDIHYAERLNRLTTLLRPILSIPIMIILGMLTSSGVESVVSEAGKNTSLGGGGIEIGLASATALMILFRQRYPKWWFDFVLELNRFMARVGAYLFLLTDRYPSTEDTQAVQLDVEYPNVEKDLNRWLPLVKWFLAIPHYIVLTVLIVVAVIVTFIAWLAILITGSYPESLFQFVVGVGRWNLRVTAYALLMTTDKYPPFSLK